MSYERSLSPQRIPSGYDDAAGAGAGMGTGYRSPRNEYALAQGGGAGMEDPYARRGRSPDDDRRGGKRRRSPSPLPPRGDSYIPSYTRERSPGGYRDRRGGGGAYPETYGGGYGGWAAPDRSYDTRGYGGRDGYDSYMAAPPSRYDSRAPAPRSTLKPPTDLPYLASFQYYKDWMRDEEPRTYDDKARLEESYKKYKSNFLYRSNRNFFDEINGMAWCKEKYGISEEEEAERKRLRAKGREGKIEHFLQTLESGDLDDLTFDQKVIAPPTPAKKDIKLPETEETKPADGEAEVKPKAEDETNGESAAAKKEEEDSTMQKNGDEKPKAEDAAAKVEESQKETTEAVKEEDATPAPNAAAPPDTEEQPTKKSDEDSILIPGSSTTLLIKTLPPDLSRADLEAHCKQVEGFDYIALAEPNPTKKFYRIGWVVFKPDADMNSAVEKLCESKINNFTLHMDLADKPTYQRLRVAPAAMAMPERVRESLSHVKQVIQRAEAEADNDNRGSAAIEARLSHLRATAEPEMKPETEDDAAVAATLQNERLEKLALDLYIHYLRTAFHTCFYCLFSGDFPEELSRKCVKHVRRNPASPPGGQKRKDNEQAWTKNFTEKVPLLTSRDTVDAIDFGGESYQDELTRLCKDHIQVEDDNKFRCKSCKKLFKAAPFVEKHIMNKHAEVIGDRLEQLKYFNNFVLDPSHVVPPPVEPPQFNNNGSYMPNGGFYGSAAGMANTFGAFNQMFNPAYGSGYGMMGGYGASPAFGGYNNMFPPMSAGFSPAGFGGGGYPPAPLSGGARALNDRIGERPYGGERGGKRQRRDAPPPPPKGARLDPRAGKLNAYTDLDGPPAGGGGDDMMLDY